MTDSAVFTIAGLEPEAQQDYLQKLATDTSKGDKVFVSKRGDNDTQLRADRTQQGLQNVSEIEQWFTHSGVGSKMESLGLHAKVMGQKLLALLDGVDPSGEKTGELRDQLQEHMDKIEAGLNPTTEAKKKARQPLKKMSVQDYQDLLAKTIDDGLKQLADSKLKLEEGNSKEAISESSEAAAQPKVKSEAKKAAEKRKRQNRRIRGKEKKAAERAATTPQ